MVQNRFFQIFVKFTTDSRFYNKKINHIPFQLMRRLQRVGHYKHLHHKPVAPISFMEAKMDGLLPVIGTGLDFFIVMPRFLMFSLDVENERGYCLKWIIGGNSFFLV